jgi:hypothetical protein
MIQAKFGLNWPNGFRGEDFWKSLQTDDRGQVMAIAHTGELKNCILSDDCHLDTAFFFNWLTKDTFLNLPSGFRWEDWYRTIIPNQPVLSEILFYYFYW